MPAYDESFYSPPAPVAQVRLTNPATGGSVDKVTMLLDTGADVTLIPRDAATSLAVDFANHPAYELIGFDGTHSTASVVQLELLFAGKSFRGQFLLIDGPHGILGRNILNRLSLRFDGPRQYWDKVES